jgi:hypothetical protein
MRGTQSEEGSSEEARSDGMGAPGRNAAAAGRARRSAETRMVPDAVSFGTRSVQKDPKKIVAQIKDVAFTDFQAAFSNSKASAPN